MSGKASRIQQGVLLSRFLLSMTDRLAYSRRQVLIAFPKIGKNTRGRLEFLTRMYSFMFLSPAVFFLQKHRLHARIQNVLPEGVQL